MVLTKTTCSRCNVERDGKHGTYCKACINKMRKKERGKRTLEQKVAHASYIREWNRKNPNKKREYRLKIAGTTQIEYDATLLLQEGRCAICREQLNEHERQVGWAQQVPDHDHGTGKFRGILCPYCNAGLGYFRDNQEFLQHAIQYLAMNQEN